MKKVTIALVLASTVVLISSCSGGYTCPTYMKLEDNQLDKIESVEIDSERV